MLSLSWICTKLAYVWKGMNEKAPLNEGSESEKKITEKQNYELKQCFSFHVTIEEIPGCLRHYVSSISQETIHTAWDTYQ